MSPNTLACVTTILANQMVHEGSKNPVLFAPTELDNKLAISIAAMLAYHYNVILHVNEGLAGADVIIINDGTQPTRPDVVANTIRQHGGRLIAYMATDMCGMWSEYVHHLNVPLYTPTLH